MCNIHINLIRLQFNSDVLMIVSKATPKACSIVTLFTLSWNLTLKLSAYSNANIGSRWCYWFHCLYHVVCSYSLARYRIERWASLSFCWASNIVWTFDDSNVNHLNYITLIVLVAWNYEINQERNEYDDSANCDESVTIQVLSYDCCLEKCLSFACTEIRYLCEIFSKPMQFNKFRRYVCDIIFNVFFLSSFLSLSMK